jgi:hypothetical protein
VHEQLLAVPWVVQVGILLFGVLDTSGVTAGDKVRQAATDARAGVPQDLSWAAVVHGAGPHSKDNVFSWQRPVVDKSLVLSHTGVKWHIVVFAPTAKRVQEQDRVLVALLDQLFSGVLEQQHVAVVQRVAHLEAVDGIGTTGGDLLDNFARKVSVVIQAVVVLNAFEETSAFGRDEPVALGQDGL